MLNEGVFWTANQLFGIKFVERFDIPVYHPDVRVWEIFDHNGVDWRYFTVISSPDLIQKAAVHGWQFC
ncbi:M3 family metallopeptidase [Shigella flexneri]